MKIKNTSDFSDATIREVVEFCKPDEVNGVTITVRNGVGQGGSSIKSKKILVVIPKHGKQEYPYLRHPRKTYRWTPNTYYSHDGQEYCYSERIDYTSTLRHPILLLSRIEELVDTMAHELRHQWQW